MPAHLIAKEGPLQGQTFSFEEGMEWTIGRDPESATFLLEDHTVSRLHARFQKKEEGLELENLSTTNPVQVNGEELIAPILLQEGDQVQIGASVFLFSEEEITSLEDQKKTGYDSIFDSLDEPAEEKEDPTAPSSVYDTIFEDTKEDNNIPLHLLANTPWMLKVISGPSAGAEIGLEAGRIYTIGKDPIHCDIVFQDLSVSRSHAKLEILEDGTAHLEDLDSKNRTLVNGEPIQADTPITPNDLVALGTTIFVIIDRGAPQETLFAPAATAIPILEEEEKEEETALQTDWKKEKIPPKYLILAGSCAAVFLIIFISVFSLFHAESMDIVETHPKEEIEKALNSFDSIQFSYNPASSKLFLVGHIKSSTDYQKMRFSLDELGFIESVEDNVVVDDLVAKEFNDVLSIDENFKQITIQAPKPGRFVAIGYLSTNEEAARLSDYFATNFPYLEHLESRVVVEGNVQEEVKALALAQGFGNLNLQLTAGELVLSGNYAEERTSAHKTFLKELNRIEGIRKIKDLSVAATESASMIDISNQFRVSGLSQFDGQGYSAVLNGKIYTLGDFVEEMKIIAIHSDAIWLEKDKIKYKINYKG